ncbi:MAG: dienelactone hydrolase family protein [Salinisphaera sp.]|nr:dienelactone hydrolase family protein [Salinisphaera sp.]
MSPLAGLIRCLPACALCAVLSACVPEVDAQPPAPTTPVGGTIASGYHDGSLRHQGRERTYTVHVPAGYDGETPMPLIVALHGGWGSGRILAEHTGLSPLAAAQGFIVVYPDGLYRAWNAGTCCGRPARKNIDDVGFIAALVAYLAERLPIDRQRVYAVGMSNGAMLAHRIACERPKLLAGFVAVAGGPMLDHCAGANHPSPALLIQGTEDPRIPWGGGTINGSYRMPFRDVVDLLATRNACAAGRHRIYANGNAACWARNGCSAPLHYCVIQGGGHQWPGGETVWRWLLGQNTDALDASARILHFLEQLGKHPARE